MFKIVVYDIFLFSLFEISKSRICTKYVYIGRIKGKYVKVSIPNTEKDLYKFSFNAFIRKVFSE